MRRLVLLFLCVSCSYQRSTPESSSYIAAVVEYQVQSNSATNLKNYVSLIQDAASQNADIIVFPEMTLTRGNSVAVPINGLLKEYPIPALMPDLYDEILVTISAAARQSEVYVVINVQEVVNCTGPEAEGENCPEQKRYLFNTNVVFDRTGAVIDRYRKINLFGEFTRTPALTPDLGIFETDFGVTFGHYICFDLMFQVPAIQVVEKMNVTDVIFSTMWFSEMPLLTAVQIQQGYAYSMNVNFLAAGANNPRVGSAGSGIYSGKAGALVSIMPGVPTTRLLVATVPKVPGEVTGSVQGPIYDNPSDQDNLVLITDPSLVSHQTRLLSKETEDFALVDKDVLCHFHVRMSPGNGNSTYRYRAAAFSGVRSFSGMATGGTRDCAIFACTGNTIDSCGKRFNQYSPNTTAIFEELDIRAVVPVPRQDMDLQASNSKYFPVSLTAAIMPLNNDQIEFDEVSLLFFNIYTLRLKETIGDMYAFGIWGRQFALDGNEPSPPREHDEDETSTPAPSTPSVPGGSHTVHHFSAIMLIISILILLKQ